MEALLLVSEMRSGQRGRPSEERSDSHPIAALECLDQLEEGVAYVAVLAPE
jgi:hypothetical protein